MVDVLSLMSMKRSLVADVLENKGDFRQPNLSAQQVVVIVLELPIREVIPPVPPSACGLSTRKTTRLTC